LQAAAFTPMGTDELSTPPVLADPRVGLSDTLKSTTDLSHPDPSPWAGSRLAALGATLTSPITAPAVVTA